MSLFSKMMSFQSSLPMMLLNIIILAYCTTEYRKAVVDLSKHSLGSFGVLDDEISGYDVTQVYFMFGSYGFEGMHIYEKIRFLDMLIPPLYMSLFVNVAYAFNHGHKVAGFVCIMTPIIMAVLDSIENVCLFYFMRSFRSSIALDENMVKFSSTATMLKNYMWYATLATFLIQAAAHLMFRNRTEQKTIVVGRKTSATDVKTESSDSRSDSPDTETESVDAAAGSDDSEGVTSKKDN